MTFCIDYCHPYSSLTHCFSPTYKRTSRWDSKGLSGHSKTIFDALHDLVSEVAAKYYELQGKDITDDLKNLVSFYRQKKSPNFLKFRK